MQSVHSEQYLHALYVCQRSRVTKPDIHGTTAGPFPEDRRVLLLSSWLLSEQATRLTGSAKKQRTSKILNPAQPTSDLPCSFQNREDKMLYMCLHALSTVIFPVGVLLCNDAHWEHPPMVTWKQSPVETTEKKGKRKKNQTEKCSLLSWEIPSSSPSRLCKAGDSC